MVNNVSSKRKMVNIMYQVMTAKLHDDLRSKWCSWWGGTSLVFYLFSALIVCCSSFDEASLTMDTPRTYFPRETLMLCQLISIEHEYVHNTL